MSDALTAQLALPGLGRPDPLGVAREDLRRVRTAWEAAQARYRDGRADEDWPPIAALQPEYFAALVLVDRLESGEKWWH